MISEQSQYDYILLTTFLYGQFRQKVTQIRRTDIGSVHEEEHWKRSKGGVYSVFPIYRGCMSIVVQFKIISCNLEY